MLVVPFAFLMPPDQGALAMLPCPVCCESAPVPLSTVPNMPLIGCQFEDSRAKALHAQCGTLELASCAACSHIYNSAFEPDLIDYVPGYENALGFSAKHRAHATATVERLIDSYDLHRKSVVEFGCGAAEFLSLLCDKGGNHGTGFDPTQRSRVTRTGEGSVTIVPELFEQSDHKCVDLVCSQHVLEHLPDVSTTLRQASGILKDQGIGYFQVPNGLVIFRDLNIWDLTYEHVSYFSPSSLQKALSKAGFSVTHLESSFGGQYLDAEAVVGEAVETVAVTPAAYPDLAGSFPSAFANVLAGWKKRIAGLIGSGRRIVLWGAGTKAVSFLNMLAISADDGIEYVVDINPRKTGRFTPGTAQRIVSPEHLRSFAPDVVVVMNPEYVGEIESMLASMRLHCDLIVVTSASA